MADKKASQFTTKNPLTGNENFVGWVPGDNITTTINAVLNYIGANISGFIILSATENDWQTADPLLPEGYILISNDLSPIKFKLTDGVNAWSGLGYVGENTGLVKIVDINNELFSSLATARTYIQQFYSGALKDENYNNGVYTFTVPASSDFSLASGFLSNTTSAQFLDPLGLITEFGDSAFSSTINLIVEQLDCNYGNRAFALSSNVLINQRNCTYGGHISTSSLNAFYLTTGKIVMNNLLLAANNLKFGVNSSCYFEIHGNIGPTEANNYPNIFGGLNQATSTIHAARAKYTSNAGGVQGDLFKAGQNGVSLFFGGIDKLDKRNRVTDFSNPNNLDVATTQATLNLVDARVQSNIKIIGDWDATSGAYPKADESNTTPFHTQWGTSIKQGWAFRVGYGQAGTVGGFEYENGDVVYALIDNPTNNPVDWGDLDHNLQQADENVRGTAKVVTAAIIADENTTDDERFVTGKKLWQNFWPRVKALAHTFAAKITFTTPPRFSSVGANQVLTVDANKDLASESKGSAFNKNFGTSANTIMEGIYTPAFSFVSGVDFVTNSTTLVNITGLSAALEANSVYEIFIRLSVQSSTNAGLNFGVNFSAPGATIEGSEIGARDSNVARALRINSFNTPYAGSSWIIAANSDVSHQVAAIVRTGASPGSLTAQILKTSSGNAKVYTDSYLKVTKV